jgi:hypothetical protein
MPEQPDDREIVRDEPIDADALAEEEAAAAAAEAARIGGPPPDDDLDPAERPVVEAGGGVAEGFEQSEEDLIRQASHEDAAAAPSDAAFSPEQESDRAGAAYGEPDEIDPTEVVADPREGDDDPGAGPGLAADR